HAPLRTRFPYTTLFRSIARDRVGERVGGERADDSGDQTEQAVLREHDSEQHAPSRAESLQDRGFIDALELRHRNRTDQYQHAARSEEHTSELQSPCNLV